MTHEVIEVYGIMAVEGARQIADREGFGGQAASGQIEIRPLEEPGSSDEDDFDRIWLRENPAGAQTERWFHATGCRRWLTLRRDVATNELHGLV